ncbi:GSCFA domain-containing protein [Aliiroseovarius crassostreae]|uniref:GSCFA domain-containing protein n=1 Tax=Aliiroseovarius crassostreae TaxID=154981 RepID=UPI00220DD121|nr:GSCFA domain-containing protein [Aliiroseovarius crassostreae]UWP91148.1 GSCFA domain-containing protein [Aliiroseovarius crassostreae]UWQ00616.1 GSCFA domain-containing protein [Aliiroseovarius crassostreae]
MADTPQNSPYQGRPSRSFWRGGVVKAGAYPPSDLFEPKFPVDREMKIFTAGSCFAQHVGRVLRENGFNVLDGEPAPEGMPLELAQKHGYRIYSGRYGNVYTVRQMRQLLAEAQGEFIPATPVWEKAGRFYDAQRPNVDPRGLASPELVEKARDQHLHIVLNMLATADLMVFTLGLTEAWEHIETGTIYPTAPGTIAGDFDPEVYRFKNFRAHEVRADFEALRDALKAINPGLKFLLTVSPVPLTATASDQHVLPATVYSKSVLRCVAGELAMDFDDVDYFPSFEIISSHPAPKSFFEDNLRSVTPEGVGRVMKLFLASHGVASADSDEDGGDDAQKRDRVRALRKARRARRKGDQEKSQADVVCEDELLEAFNK